MSHVGVCARFVAPFSLSSVRFLLGAFVASLGVMAAVPSEAHAQNGYVAAIAYSQKTGKIGHTARQARTDEAAKSLALRACNEPDAKVWMWGRDQWVAIATADGLVGAAGFGRGRTAEEAQRKALAECAERSHGADCRVELCVYSGGARPRDLATLAGDPQSNAARRAGFVAAIAYSPKTGKIGSTAGVARSKKEAHEIALKACNAPDAKVYMWGPEWVAIATVENRPGVAGFAPGATREIAERAALEQARKLGRGDDCKIALAIHAAGDPAAKSAEKSATQTTASPVVSSTPAPAGSK